MPIIRPICKMKLPAWDLDKMAEGMNTTRELAGSYLVDGRLCNGVIARCLAARGFVMEEDGKTTAAKASGGGYIMRSKKTGAGYKLKIATKKLDLTPPENSGDGREYDRKTVLRQQEVIDGYAIVFTAELCRHPPMPPQDCVYFISKAFCHQMVADGILNGKFRADKSEPVMNYLRQKLGEPTLSSIAQAAVAASLAYHSETA